MGSRACGAELGAHRGARMTRQVRRDRVHVTQVHRQGVVALGPERERNAGRCRGQQHVGMLVRPFELVVDSGFRRTGLRRPAQCAAVRLVSVDEQSRGVRELQRGMTRDLWSYVRRLAREGFLERDWGCFQFAALLEGQAPRERLVLQFVPAADDVAAAVVVADWPAETGVAFLAPVPMSRVDTSTPVGETLELSLGGARFGAAV